MIQVSLFLGEQSEAVRDLRARLSQEEWALVVAFATAVLAQNGKTIVVPVSELGQRALAQSGDWLDGPAKVRL